jgi:hypothetical protein
VAYTKPFPKANAVKRALDMALKSPVPVRSVDFIDSDGKKTSFNIGEPQAAPTTNELDDWMAKKNASHT